MAEPPLMLRCGCIELKLSPSIGGSISSMVWDRGGNRTPILRESHSEQQNVLEAASFPLVPFVNRIRGGCFEFRGRAVRLSPNIAGDPSPLHGQGWTSEWRVESQSECEAVLAFDHPAGEWPWAYQARQNLRLVGDSLWLDLSCRNVSDEPMPCGLGIHPYFNCGHETRIQTSVANVWTVDEQVLPVEKVAADGRYSIADSPVCGRGLATGYDGWSGRAVVTDPIWPFEIELSSRQARFFQLYSPAEGGLFVAEPVTHANAALNEPQQQWAALGIRILQPGEEMVLEARIQVQPGDSALG